MTAANVMQQQIRLGFRQASVVAAVGGSDAAHDGVVAFAAEPTAAIPASRLPIANWCTVSTVAGSAANGTTYKFTRKGIYSARVMMPLVAGAGGIGMVAISLDSTAAFLDATNVTPTNALAVAEDYDIATGVATLQISLRASAQINITNALRGSAAAADGQVGTMRIHAGTGAGAVIGTSAVTVANVILWVNAIAEIFG
jgi:hypothetical protein